jgi:hypothetical protein
MQNTAGDSVRITQEPCLVSSGWLKLGKAYMIYKGREYEACYIVVKDIVLIFDSGGDVSPIPLQMFKRDIDA